MTLLELLKSKTSPEQEAFAEACGTSVQYLFHVARGDKNVGVPLIVNIERESGGKIRCEDLRSDVDWAVIRNTKQRKRA